MNERCFYADNNDPYFFLSPLKLEIIMTSPIEIYIFHDVVTNKEINTITTQANFKVINSLYNDFLISQLYQMYILYQNSIIA